MSPVGDISTFKHYFHCILNAEWYTHLFQRLNRPNFKLNALMYSILTKIIRAFAPDGDISTLKRYFHCILNAEWYARLFQRRNRPNFKLNAPMYSILTKIKRAFAPDGDVSTFKRYLHCILHA